MPKLTCPKCGNDSFLSERQETYDAPVQNADGTNTSGGENHGYSVSQRVENRNGKG